MAVNQLSVFVENQVGRIAAVADLIASSNINMYAMSVADTADFGIMRLIVDKYDLALEILREHGTIATLTPVTVAEIPNEPGGLAKVLWILAGAGIGIEYLYAFVAASGKHAYVVLRVADNDAAAAILSLNNIPLISEAEVADL